MQVVLQLFAGARQRVGSHTIAVDLAEGATVADLKRALAARHPELAPMMPGLRIALGDEYAGDDQAIPRGVEIAVIPPVSGGQR